jgi:carboxypeptidase C (cathepsin A)
MAALQSLLDSNITLIMYFGDADYNCNWLGGQVVADNLDPPGYQEAGFTNISSSDGVVHGQVRQAGKFAFVRIYESGHEVPFYVSRPSYNHFYVHNTLLYFTSNSPLLTTLRNP